MTLSEASNLFGIPLYLLNYWKKKGLIGVPLADHNINNLAFFKAIMFDDVALKALLAKRTLNRRRRLIRTCETSRYQSYIFTRFEKAHKNKIKLKLLDVAKEVSEYYKRPFNEKLIAETKTIRRKVYQLIYRQKAAALKGKESEDRR